MYEAEGSFGAGGFPAQAPAGNGFPVHLKQEQGGGAFAANHPDEVTDRLVLIPPPSPPSLPPLFTNFLSVSARLSLFTSLTFVNPVPPCVESLPWLQQDRN